MDSVSLINVGREMSYCEKTIKFSISEYFRSSFQWPFDFHISFSCGTYNISYILYKVVARIMESILVIKANKILRKKKVRFYFLF